MLSLAGFLFVGLSSGEVPTVEIAPGVNMPSINVGTWSYGNGQPSDPSIGVPPWIEAGGTGLDCAWDYFNQAKVAAAVESTGKPRESLFITTKVPGIGDALQKMKVDLQQLNTSYADLTLLHMPSKNPATNAAQWKSLEQALAMKLTRSIGISNFNSAQIEELMKTATVTPAVNQCDMGVANHDDATIKYCQAKNITYEAWGAMKGCNFTDPTIGNIAKSRNVSVAQVCLRYVIDRGCVLAVGTGNDAATAKAYAVEDMGIFDFALTSAEMALLNAL